ncbi:hypothetical protein FGADI_11140 [Fusarium gaditjirri]|uniref:Trichothecene 3-O-acetyltransferase n=1 Tax=Fusarium gaditjirri TaxID=282569 RepID=A0A8H4WQG5_9HYPO|nr:hypothetical protein FGADI_11140 [Fusarium gaditjirri]
MVSVKILGALALFSLGFVEASVCKPHPSSVASSATGTASSLQSSATESSFIETTSTAGPSLSASEISSSSGDATSTLELSTTLATLISTSATLNDISSTTQAAATSTTGEFIEPTTTAEATATSAALDTTTTSVEATTSSAAPAPEPTFRLFTYDSQDPTLNGGIGYCKLEQYQTSQTVFFMKFTPTSASAPTFKINPSTGALTVVSGLLSSSGEIMGATTLNGIASTSFLKIVQKANVDTGLQELISCSIATDQYNKLAILSSRILPAPFHGYNCCGLNAFPDAFSVSGIELNRDVDPTTSASTKYYGHTSAIEKTTHALTVWDCEPLYQNMTPILGWALRGDVNVERMSNTLKLSVLRKAPWLAGRLAWRGKRFKIDIPEASQDRSEPFRVTTFKAPNQCLHEILPNYIPPGSASPSVKRFDPRRVPCLQPLASFTKTAHQCVTQNERLMHLHFVMAKDLTLMCVAWQHVVLDAPALKPIVAEWEGLLAKDVDTRTHDPDNQKPEIEGLKDRPNLDELISTLQTNSPSSFPGWTDVTLWGGLKLKLVSKIYSLRYPRTFGTAYLPPKLVAGLVERAACGIYRPRTATTLSRAVNLRGKHHLISPGVSGNALGLAVMPSVQSGALQNASLQDLALATRRSVKRFKDPDYVSRFLGFRMNCGNAGRIAIPEVKLSNQRCLITSFVNLGLSNPDFGEGVSVERPVQLTMEPVVIRVIDDPRGGWSIHGNLPHAAWDALERNMNREMETLDAKF